MSGVVSSHENDGVYNHNIILCFLSTCLFAAERPNIILTMADDRGLERHGL